MLVIIAILVGVSAACTPIPWLMDRLTYASQRCGKRLLSTLKPLQQNTLIRVTAIEHRLTLLVLLFILSAMALSRGWLLIAMALLLIAMVMWLPLKRRLSAQRQDQERLVAALPAQLDVLAMLLSAGQPLLSSLDHASRSTQPNPLQQAFRGVVAKVRSGESMQQAIDALAQHNPSREVRLFCHALQHARESGAGLAGILQQQAEQRRQELFLAAERRAMEAPVKMMFPLLLFIFPATILVLGVTLAAKIMWGT